MWRILIGGALGFGLAKLLGASKDSKGSATKQVKTDSKPSQTEKKLTWKEEVISAIDKEGFDYAFDGYSERDEPRFKNAEFQKARKSYVSAKQSLENYIPKIKNEKARVYVESVVDNEGFDYGMEGYSDFKKYKDDDTGKHKPFTDEVFHAKLKKYLETRRAVLKSLD